ncbi:YebC/PmpR family DNA-binding transcriptional regulator [bacterium]|nr:YebC/PmpR family DNA-binding transcriptional regulator [bacterium]
MSGHNKWSKIKHKKAATDAQKSKIFSKHSSLIAVESRKANGDVSSPGLAAAIERAKKDSMPKENIEKAVAKGSGVGGAALEEVMFEAFGPGGTALIVTAVTDNNNRIVAEVRHIFSKAGFELGTSGSALWAFTKTEDGYKPNTPLELSDEDGEKLANLIEALEENDDVQDVYTTADTPDDV